MEKKAKEKTPTNSEGTLKVAKKPYASPQLIEYGNVEKLTRGGGATATDGQGAFMHMCL